ncbi:hypothetical protein F8C76_03045 [Flagellimonas olearia]|uniref:Pectate lyase n=1 Tax=Flagellimonas olearia TaxID=552546 RepID=A0A6I1E217_9FLAO|nr:hypothetical protein [Allomuricauda olearia]KAB7530499.1 hypothetical protein F8C76_03045 [Allomuricauda olearia]
MKRLLFKTKMTSIILFLSLLLGSCNKDSDLFYDIVQEDIEETIDENQSEQGETPGESVVDNEVSSELKAFPTAFGAGAYVTGGRGGKVIYVSNLNDSGPGSLRDALEASGKRMIVFSVAGVINLESSLFVRNGDFTISGQTAPAGGITIAGARVVFQDSDNMIIRYIRFRGGVGSHNDSVSGYYLDGAIFDHCSVGFGADEAISIITDVVGKTTSNITLQRSLMGDSKTGGLFGSSENPSGVGDISVLENLWYNITHRFPNIYSDGNVEVINNVIWRYVYRTSSNTDGYKLNHINNWHLFSPTNSFESLYKTGPKHSIWSSSDRAPSIYSHGNVYEPYYSNPDIDNFDDSWSIHVTYDNSLKRDDPLPKNFKSDLDFPLLGAPINIKTAYEAFSDVSTNVGANARLDANGNVLNNLDVLDVEYLDAVTSGTILPRRDQLTQYIVPPINGGAHYVDNDNDGMPDEWEEANGLDTSIDDSAQDKDGDGYTNLEEFLNLVDL